jgi:hypothetical protein
MSSSKMDGQSDISDAEFPRFLSRGDALDGEPVPLAAWRSTLTGWRHRVRPIWAQAPSGKVVGLALGAMTIGITAFVGAKELAGAAKTATQSTPVTRAQPVSDGGDQVADAVQIVTAFEARLGYASHMSSQIDLTHIASQMSDGLGDQRANAITTEAETVTDEDRSDAVAALVIRDLPDGITFSTGVSGGASVWVMAAGDSVGLEVVARDGVEPPTSADVDMISRSGIPLGSLRLPLKRQEPQNRADVAAVPLQEPGGNSIDSASAPAQLQRRPVVKRVVVKQVQVEPQPLPKRVVKRPDDAYRKSPGIVSKAEPVAPSVPNGKDEEKPTGPISKFIAWLKSGQKKTDSTESPSALGLRPPD